MSMTRFTVRMALVTAAWVMLCAFSAQKTPPSLSQPSEERKAQDMLPQSHDPIWNALAHCKVHYSETKHTYSIDYTPQVKAMVGKPITVSGFLMPLDPTETSKHYLLSKRTPTCPYCPPGEPNEIVELFTTKPIKWTENMVRFTGTMKFTTNPDLGLFFQLNDSEMAKEKAL